MKTNTIKSESARRERYNEINRYTSFMLVLFFVFNFAILILNEVGVFCTDKIVMRVSVSAVGILAFTPFVLARIGDLGGRNWFAYFIIVCAAGIVVASIICQGFNASLCIVFPLLIAISYYSRSIIVYGMAVTCVAAAAASYLCGLLSNSAAVFAYNMTYLYSPQAILRNTELVPPAVREGKISLTSGLVAMYALPNCIILLCLYMVVRVIIKIRVQRRAANDKKIYEMKNQVLTAMSDIVENRDTSTGGHVKRTTDVVEILMNNLDFSIEDKGNRYKEYVIKAAATHDLGKIAISDAILKKPGKLTDEEFAQIKMHPVKSEELINQVLGPIESEEFMDVARNLAKYHHERYDGKGYPERLSGDNIPLEARIMAIADVYDALVSKRCYKDSISHEAACDIIHESMGSQFDPKLLVTFNASAESLKNYYSA